MVHRLSKSKYLASHGGTAHLFEITGARGGDSSIDNNKEDVSQWGESTIDIGDYKVIPHGSNNDLPNEIRDTMMPNHLAGRIQKRKVELLIGQGPFTYIEEPDGKNFTRKPVLDKAINEWLQSINYHQLLIDRATEFINTEQIYSRVSLLRGGRLGNTGSFNNIISETSTECRLAYKRNDARKIPTHVFIGDPTVSNNQDDFQVLPLWDPLNPTKHPFSIHYCKLKSFGVKHYTMPSTYGVLPWIRRSTTIPLLIEKLTDNSLNIRYHITSPAKYWEDQEEKLKKNCENEGIPYKESMLDDFYYKTMDTLTEVLSGAENVGKFWHNQTVTRLIGGTAVEEGWKIEPIKQEIKEYVEAQIKVSDKSDFAVQAGLALHAALANVGADGKSDSGSEQLYAYQIHQISSTALAEFYVTKVLNDIIRLKFNSDIKVGFYQIAAQAQEDVTQSQRVKYQTR